jgi:hypothetical protein
MNANVFKVLFYFILLLLASLIITYYQSTPQTPPAVISTPIQPVTKIYPTSLKPKPTAVSDDSDCIGSTYLGTPDYEGVAPTKVPPSKQLKTYKESYFSFKLPSNWEVVPMQKEKCNPERELYLLAGDDQAGIITINALNIGHDSLEYLRKSKFINDKEQPQIKRCIPKTLGKLSGYFCFILPYSDTVKTYFFIANSNGIMIDLSASRTLYQPELDQILTSLKLSY